MKPLEINISLTKQNNFFDLSNDVEIRNIRLTTNNFADLRNLELILKIFFKDKVIFKKLIQPVDKNYEIFELGFQPKLIADRIEIESRKNLHFYVIGLINF